MKKKNDYPSWICFSCGKRHGNRKPGDGATWHEGECGVCGKKAIVTEPRDFGHLKPDWNIK